MTLTDPASYADPLMHTMMLTSQVNGSDYEIRVGLPYTYHLQATKNYPVFVVLDGEGLFLSANETCRVEWATSTGALGGGTGVIPEFIVVGICLPGTNMLRRNFEYWPRTGREELTPSMQAFVAQAEAMVGQTLETGGADAFLQVLEQEILPGVARHFRMSDDLRMFFGHSASASFVTQVLLTRPDLFTDYIIASPGIIPEMFRRETAWAAAHDDLSARVTLTAGERELRDPLSIVSGTMQLAEALYGRNYPGLALDTWLVPDALHHRTVLPSIVRALSKMGGLGAPDQQTDLSSLIRAPGTGD